MQIDAFLTDDAVLSELGARLARVRLDRDITQRELADRAGVGRRAVQRIERGEAVTTPALIRVLRALDLMDAMETLVPPPTPSPIALLKLQGRTRQRASGAHAKPACDAAGSRPWRWGDER